MNAGPMPQRPRSHVLDTTSERKFKVTIPEAWLATSPERDYGIDLQVEVFDPDPSGGAMPTGLQLGAQLKATDSEEAEAFRIGVRWETVNYWLSLPFPVLLVRYLADSDRIFATWVHRCFDSFIGATTAKAWFEFDQEADLLTPERAAGLPDEVRHFMAVQRQPVVWPVIVAIVDRVNEPELVSRLVQDAARIQDGLSRRVDFRVGASMTPGAELVLSPDRIVVDLGGGVGGVLDTYGHTAALLQTPNAAPDVLAMAAAAFGRLGADDASAALLERILDRASPPGGSFPLSLGITALRAGKRDLVIRLIERAAGVAPPAVTTLANLMVPAAPRAIDAAEKQTLKRVLTSIVDNAAPAELGRRQYGRANWLRIVRDLPAAEEGYLQATRDDPSLAAHHFYWRELAGVYFERGNYDASERAYTRAMELGDTSPRCRALHADVVLHQGRYAEAATEFEEIANASDDAFAILGADAAKVIVALAGATQERDKAAGNAVVARYLAGELSDDDAIQQLFDADALHPMSWQIAASQAARHQATPGHVIAAWLARVNVVYWVHAVMSVLAQSSGSPRVQPVVELAEHYAGEALEPLAAELWRIRAAEFATQQAPEQRRQTAQAMSSQLSTLRNLVDDARRARGSGDLLRPR